MDGWVGLDRERLLSPIVGRPLDSFNLLTEFRLKNRWKDPTRKQKALKQFNKLNATGNILSKISIQLLPHLRKGDGFFKSQGHSQGAHV